MRRRAFVVVMDACGAGELPDAADYGDAGANTLGHVAEAAAGLDLPVLGALGLGSALPLAGVPPAAEPVVHGRLAPLGPGKDTVTGHWELMGVVTPAPLRTYPEGFAAVEDYGERQLQTGHLIVYTSADSVLQIAGHVDEIPPAELYAACEAAREVMRGEHTATPGTDHTREHAPLLARFAGHGGRRHDGPLADVGASVLRWLSARDATALPGEPFTP